MATRNTVSAMLTCRVSNDMMDDIEFMAALHGWSRTTWVRRAVDQALQADKELFESPTRFSDG